MGRKNRKNKKKYNNPHYASYSNKTSTKDIHRIAYDVFGSLYYTPNK